MANIKANPSPQIQYFAYDSHDRLTSADAVGGQFGLYSETYSYDANTGNLASKAGVNYTYGDTNHAHAVTILSNDNTYNYDANGNQITRIVGTDTYAQIYDAENKLIQVVKNGNTLASFVYDGDGTRVASTINGVTTRFIGEYYEVSGSDITKNYGGKTAMRKNGVVTYLLSDHLGSNSLVVDSSGNVLSETRYKAWGELRFTTGTTTTPYTYTGQYSNTADFGWMYYKARWYDSSLGRFSQADTIVPGAGDPRAWDRYSYVKNNPVRYNDPSGHFPDIPPIIPPLWGCSFINNDCDQLIRDQQGGAMVTNLAKEIELEATQRGINPVLISGVIRHESSARERRLFLGLADLAESIEAFQRKKTGLASIGIGQMQIRRAQELEQLGYVPAQTSYWGTVNALLNPSTAVSYIGGMLEYLHDKLTSTFGSSYTNLSQDYQERLILIGYNQGWDGVNGLNNLIQSLGYGKVLTRYKNYPNKALDQYNRWRSQIK